MIIEQVPGEYSVCRLPAGAKEPAWFRQESFYAVVQTTEELSVVCASDVVPPEIKAEHGWSLLKVAGPLDFSETGVLSSLAGPLAAANISIFVVSTYDTDYLLVKTDMLGHAVKTLQAAGHQIISI
ncbi:MAG: ACT domain-containing protein [Gammaproteobacteria bacterium]|nr:ACT domain-containing protein [Gammaproteobacteria bacterium]